MDWVTAHDLDNWSGTRDSQDTLPEIVRRLIHAAIPDVSKLRFPSGDAVRMRGFDGILITGSITHRYVPAGTSVWEFGTGEDPEEKATQDYKKRTENPQGVDPKTTTYVAVTSRMWDTNRKTAWCAERQQRGEWLAVKAYDAVDLEAWLRDCPTVGVWVAERLRLMPEGVYSMEEVWERWCQSTRPIMPGSVPLAGRKQQSTELLRILDGEPQAILVQTGSAEEALAFVAGTIAESTTHQAHTFPRSIVVYDKQVARQVSSHTGLVIALLEGAGEIAGRLIQGGNHVIIPLGNEAVGQRTTIKLPWPGRAEFAASLKGMCESDEAAERLAMECGRSATILRRRKTASQADLPDWASPSNARTIIPGLLAGGWDDNCPADKEVLASLAGENDNAIVEERLHRLTTIKDPPLRRVGSVWKLTAPVDAFELLARQLTRADFDHYTAMAMGVLGENDPSLAVPADERLYAGIRGQTLKHSHHLRAGMAHMALLTATLGSPAGIISLADPQNFIDSLIFALFPKDAPWQRWGSIRDYLSVLAEAAPDPFLEALELQLEGHERDLVNLFEAPTMFGGGSPHNSILWALETLAWSPKYLPRVTLALAKLERIAPSHSQANHPIDSLCAIFLCWYPNTNATLAQRMAAIDLLLEHEPEIGWRLLSLLLPQFHGIGHQTSTPELREFGKGEHEDVTWQILGEGYREVTARLLARVGADPERWKVLIHALPELHPEDRAQALQLLRATAFGDNRDAVWMLLRDFVSQHRAYAEAKWTLQGADLDAWEQALALLKPSDPIVGHRYLFDDYYPEVPEQLEFEAREQAITSLRQEGIKAIMGAAGNDGLLRLIDECKYPEIVAISIPKAILPIHDCLSLLVQTHDGTDHEQHFASVLSVVCLERFGAAWRASLLGMIHEKQWDHNTAALLLGRWPDEPATWDTVASLGPQAEEAYWRTKPVLRIQGTSAEREQALRKLMSVKRYTHAIRALRFDQIPVSSPLLVELLLGAVDEINERGTTAIDASLCSEIADILESLYQAPDADQTVIARLEYTYFPLLQHSWRKPLGLHRLLARDPAFFAEVLSHAFKARHREEEEPLSEAQLLQARQALELLMSWEAPVPGTRDDGTIDEEQLWSWVAGSHKLATKADRAAIGDQQIGKILARTRDDPDGQWPHRAARRVFEKLRNKDIELGFQSECFNKRGAHTRDPKAGGAPERALEAQYRAWANAIDKEFPLTAGVLNRIADNWGRQAKYEDERSEKWNLEG